MSLRIMPFDDMDWRRPGAPVPDAVAALVSSDFTPPAGLLLVGYDAETQEKIIATAGYRRVTPEICEARNVVVYWGHQTKGVGRALMDRLLAEARNAGYTGMRAEAPDSVPALIAFYNKTGFTRAPIEFQRPGFIRFERAL